MKRIIHIAIRDMKNSGRDPMILYTLVAPFLLAALLLFVAPEQDQINLSFVMIESTDVNVIEAFERYGTVELVASEEAINARVRGTDEVIGIVFDGEYVVVTEGNETPGLEDIPALILQILENPLEGSLTVNITNLGRGQSIIRTEGAKFILLFVFVMPGILVGLNIVEEKESNAINALMVTPLSKVELFLGKSVFGILFSFVQLAGVIVLLGYTYMNPWMVVAMYVPAILAGLLLGYIIGAVTSDQIAALGLIKFGFMPLMVSFLGTLFIPQGYWWTLYWSPYFFLYQIISDLMLDIATWNSVGIQLGITLAISIGYIAIGGRLALKAI
jgi:ABC-2 type transport system permease protein